MEYVVIKANRQRLSSNVKVKGRVKVKCQGQGQRSKEVRVKVKANSKLDFDLEKSSTCGLEMNLVMDRKFDLEMTLTFG